MRAHPHPGGDTGPVDLVIPDELRPQDGRFGSGPSKIRTDAVARLASVAAGYLGTSHRREGVRSVVRRVRHGLATLFQLPAGYEVLLGNGGSTAFWDAAAASLVQRRCQHIVCGEFSAKFAEVTRGAPFLADPDIVEGEPGTVPDPQPNPDVDAYALIHNETSTGAMSDVRRPVADGIVLVDATSAAGGLRVDPTQFDVYYFAPQKAFASEGGLWIALCSPAALERIEHERRDDRWVPASLDLRRALENSRLDQTYNTPSLSTLFLLADTIEWMLDNGGLEWAASRCDESAEIVYGWAESRPYTTPFVVKPSQRSHVTATIDFEGVNADAVARILRANGIVDIESYRKLGRNQLRLATFPAIEPADVAALTACIDFVVEAMT